MTVTAEPVADGGSLPVTSVGRIDGDPPFLWVLNQVAEEPVTGSVAITGRAELSVPAATAVRFTLATADGTASAGTDYQTIRTELVIPSGESGVSFMIQLLADSAIEGDESFSVSVSDVTGAQAPPGEATTWTIRDADILRPVVHAEAPPVYEGLGPVALPVHFVETDGPLIVPWSLQPVAIPAGVGGDYPIYGPDLTPDQSGLLSSGPSLSTHLQVSARRDLEADPDEYISAVFDLGAGVEAGSFARRFVEVIESDTDLEATTDGNWVVAVGRKSDTTGARYESITCYSREPAAPGGWKKRSSVPALTPVGGGPMSVKMRKGRLLVCDFVLSRAWVYKAPATADGAWVLEAEFPAPLNLWSAYRTWDFDGDTLVFLSGDDLIFRERGEGKWLAAQKVGQLGTRNGLVGGLVLDGARCAVAGFPVGTTPGVQILERAGPPLAPWILRATLPQPDAENGFRALLLLGRFLAVLGSDSPTRVFEHAPDGSWPLRQVIADSFLFVGRSLFFGADSVYALTGTADAPWQPLGRTSWFPHYEPGGDILDACGNVMVRRESLPGPGWLRVPGISISEPGVEPVIGDEQSLGFSYQFGEDNTEGISDVKYADLYVQFWNEAPLAISIPYRTLPAGGTATPDVDYWPVEGVLTIPAGQEGAWLRVPVLPDADLEPTETIRVQFDAPSYGPPSLMPVDLSIIDAPLGLAPPGSTSLHVFEPASGSETFILPFTVARPQKQDLAYQYEVQLISSTQGAATAEDVVIANGAGTLHAGSTAVPVPLTVMADTLVEGDEIIEVIVMLPNQQPRRFSVVALIGDRAPPGTLADTYTISQGVVLPVSPARNVLANDPSVFSGILPSLPALAGHVEVHSDGTFRYEPAPNFFGTDRWAYRGSQGSAIVLHEPFSWTWLHPLDGRDPELDQPGFQAQWMSPMFDDSGWSPGTGLMGRGTLGAEPGRPIDTHLGKPINRSSNPTAYFRTHFQGPAEPTPGVTIRFACAGGVIFYLNGEPIGRHAPAPMGSFATAADTFSLVTSNSTITGPAEMRPITLFFPTAAVLPGSNVLAVSLHTPRFSTFELGLQVFEITTGAPTAPVHVDVEVTDALQPPVVRDDTYLIRTTTTPLDSMLLLGGSAYANDGLLSPSGVAYDPILEVDIGGAPAGPVQFDMLSGHFAMDAPEGYFGTTSFTYRLRDKDGWSNPSVVTLDVSPSRSFDIWRQAQFGGDSTNPQSNVEADGDGDGRTNLMEFALGSSPVVSDSVPAMELSRSGGVWVADFTVATGFGRDVFIGLEQATSLAADSWHRVAWLNDSFPHLEVLAPGIAPAKIPGPDGLTRYRISLPPTMDAASFLRLRVFRGPRPIMPPPGGGAG